MFRKDIVIPSGAMALALCVFSAQADPLKATQYGDFDRYVLALSWQTGFCQSMAERNRNEPEECRPPLRRYGCGAAACSALWWCTP